MKKNAIIIAGIMLVTGCATHQSGYATGERGSAGAEFDARGHTIRSTETIDRNVQGVPSGPLEATASQYDPARSDTFHANSSIRGGSGEARGWRNYDRSDYDVSMHPMNPTVQADSSIRGGSWQSRDRDWNTNPEPSSGMKDNRIKVDSSIRGGSNAARGFESSDQGEVTRMHSDLDMYRGAESNWNNEVSQGTAGHFDTGTAANWNPSDDLLRDNTNFDQSHNAGVLTYDELSGSDHSSSRNLSSQSSSQPVLDDMTAPSGVGGAGSYQSGSSQSSADVGESKGDLNSSKNLEQDISGRYNLGNRRNSDLSSTSDQMTTEDVGGPGSSETGSSSSVELGRAGQPDLIILEEECPDAVQSDQSTGYFKEDNSNVGGPAESEQGSDTSVKNDQSTGVQPESKTDVTTDQEHWLYRNNPAQGVGSTATGEFGVANSSGSMATGMMNDDQLARKVKESLVKESTGTFGITSTEARSIQVTAHSGTVTLKGSVPNEKDKRLAEVRANEVAGVKRIDNQLTISPNANPASRDLGNGRNLEENTDHLRDQFQD